MQKVVNRTDLIASARNKDIDDIVAKDISLNVIGRGQLRFYDLITFIDDDDSERILIERSKYSNSNKHTKW